MLVIDINSNNNKNILYKCWIKYVYLLVCFTFLNNDSNYFFIIRFLVGMWELIVLGNIGKGRSER